jgi:hypothetical protein
MCEKFEGKKSVPTEATKSSEVKVKCTIVQALRLCTGRTVDMGVEV